MSSLYRAYGSIFESPFPLTGFDGVDRIESGQPPVSIRFVDQRPSIPAPTAGRRQWVATADEVVVEHPGEVVYRIHRTGGIEVFALSDAGRTDAYIHGIPIAAALTFAGRTVLHGAAASIDGGAVVFVGPNGVGKSSTALALADLGGTSLCDNLASIEVHDDRAALYPGTSTVKLWADMADTLERDVSTARRVLAGMDKFVVPARLQTAGHTAVRALVEIRTGDVGSPQLDLATPERAAATVMRNHFRGAITRAVQPDAFERAAQLAAVVPVFVLARPRHACAPRQVAAHVRERLAERRGPLDE